MPETDSGNDSKVTEGKSAPRSIGLNDIGKDAPSITDIAPGSEAELEEEDLGKQAKRIKNKSDDQDVKLRKEYTTKIFNLVLFWLNMSLAILLYSGFSEYFHFKLSDSVLIALISGVTVNVIGLLMVVVNYLFKK